ncbi:MAG: hypothetical protein U9P79_06460 [Candidatus Cloacimonadota bacterium]|nr:hypothetical protein [Candidatus Cloacimonadota bacterium]
MQTIDIAGYIEVLKEHKKQIVIVFLVIFIPIFFISFEMEPTYESEITLFTERVPEKTEEIVFRRGSTRIDMTREIIRLKSLAFTKNVVRSLPEFVFNHINTQLTLKEKVFQRIKKIIGEKNYFKLKKLLGRPEELIQTEIKLENSVINFVKENVNIRYRGKSIVTIKATSNSPEVAYQIVQGYTKLWQSINLEINKNDLQTAKIFIETEVEKAKEQLLTSENNYHKYKKYLGVPINMDEWDVRNLDPELAKLSSEVQSSRESYYSWYKKLQEIQIWEKLIKSDIQIADAAQIPKRPSGSSKSKVQIIAFLFAFIFSFGIPILIDFLKDYIKQPIDIERLLKLPVVAVIPNMER